MTNTGNYSIALLMCILLLAPQVLYSQEADSLRSAESKFNLVEQAAEPVGGYSEFYSFIAQNMTYPTEARKEGIVGNVFVEFLVQSDGSLTDLKVVKGIGGGCDEEVVRVLKLAPKWIPARQGGKAVQQKITVPVNFKIKVATAEQAQLTPETLKRSLRRLSSAPDMWPEFPGGDEAFNRYVNKEMRDIPNPMILNFSNNCVVLEFTVNLAGNVTNLEIKASLGSAFDEEAIRLVRNMPRWLPAMKDNKIVEARATREILFGEVSRMHVETANSFFKSGVSYFNEQQYKKALKFFSKAIEKNPYSIDYYFNRGATYINLKETSQGCKDLDYIRQLDPQAQNLFESYCK